MALFCPDNQPADFPPAPPAAKPERGAPWKPPEVVLCMRCLRAAWQHGSVPPVLADDLDRAIYAAAFVAAMQREGMPADPATRVALAIQSAEVLVEQYRRARLGA